jgi:hypothetical protein
MSVNKYQPHILVLPEDDANRQLANGFVLDLDQALLNRIRVLEEAGGWTGVLERFISDHVADMERFTERFMVLLIDFDGSEGRLQDAKARIPRAFDRESLYSRHLERTGSPQERESWLLRNHR